MSLRKVYYTLSPNLRLLARRVYYFPTDITYKLFAKKEFLTPPKGMIFTGSGDFIKQGETFLKHFIDLGNLKPKDCVLDIGSGIGRMAIPLTKYLTAEGKYEGFDIVKKGVKWCKQNITKKFPNFNFQHIELKNSLYNLSTSQDASNFTFPYVDNHFDFIFLTSVFSHMLPSDIENYLKEISRVMKKTGTCLFTCFFINQGDNDRLFQNKDFQFSTNKGNYFLMNEKVPEANVAYKFDYLEKMIHDAGLKIKTVHPGYWSDQSRENSFEFQDIFILEK